MTNYAIDDRLARRNSIILAGAQSFAGAMPTIVVAMGGLVGYYLLGADKSLATVPVSSYVFGTAAMIYPAAFLMKRLGRKLGFLIGAFGSSLAGLLSCFAILQGSFWLFCFGTFLSGAGQAFVAQYRFAAADTASEAFRPKAISWVMVGGILAGIIGPQTSILTKDLFEPVLFAGAFLGQAVLGLVGVLFLLFLQVPDQTKEIQQQGGRPLVEIVSQFRFIVAASCAAVTYALMSFVMTATPLAMIACNHSQEDATLAIQWHVLGMFGPSFFTGSLIQKFGKEKIVVLGLFMLAGCSTVALMGIEVANFWIALILLGVGWNFAFIGATTMLTDCYHPSERAKTQATNDFLVFGTVTIASFSSGGILNAFGWEKLNWVMFPPVVLCLLLLMLQAYKKRTAIV
ncbi:MFS transporter [Cohaesibacter celericrescens]|uniref:MFS transporter n=1 Tax=Cohaesibacter celericrescens TaxID=2067669 RepID=UPI0035647477